MRTPRNADHRRTPAAAAACRRTQGRSLSDYVTAAPHAAVQKDMEEMATFRLTREASEQFARALIDPPEPSPALQRAFELRRSLVRSS
jgi:uncharacterized protein (DUF1778 family)